MTISNLGQVALEIQSIIIKNDAGLPATSFPNYCNGVGEYSLISSSSLTILPGSFAEVEVRLDYLGVDSITCGENENYYLFNTSDLQNTIQIASNDPARPVSIIRLGGNIIY